MSNCCCESTDQPIDVCPGCEKPVVSIETIKAMVDIPLWNITPGDQFFYDADEDSEMVYLSTQSGMIINESELREKVFAKNPDDDDCYVCYCFKIKIGDLRQATIEERQTIFERLKAASNKNQCSCKTRNPKGSCCIGDVKALIDKFNRQ
jgi:hypothetical protein